MVFVNDKKYACETCIKGHRSSTCQHTDRPLYEIKKKGRPVTQCEHCRELRKTKQVHVKCLCEDREDHDSAISHSIPAKKANRKDSPVSAAFPNGLKGVTGIPISFHPPSKGSQSDNPTEFRCTCNEGGNCVCSTPRHAPRAVKGEQIQFDIEQSTSRSSTPPKVKHDRNRSSTGHFPLHLDVTHGPSKASRDMRGPIHDLSSDSRGHPMRSSHGSALYTPYSIAHDHAHAHNQHHEKMAYSLPLSNPLAPPASYDPIPMYAPESNLEWSMGASEPNAVLDLCDCGNGCTCGGCKVHRGNEVVSGAPCSNPGKCGGCLNCLFPPYANAPIPTEAPSTEPLVDSELGSLEEWVRQVSFPQQLVQYQTNDNYGTSPIPWNETMVSAPPVGVSTVQSCGQCGFPVEQCACNAIVGSQFDGVPRVYSNENLVDLQITGEPYEAPSPRPPMQIPASYMLGDCPPSLSSSWQDLPLSQKSTLSRSPSSGSQSSRRSSASSAMSARMAPRPILPKSYWQIEPKESPAPYYAQVNTMSQSYPMSDHLRSSLIPSVMLWDPSAMQIH